MTLHDIHSLVRFDGDTYFIDDDIVDLYGVGKTVAEAQEDYWRAVQEAYDDLSANEDRLSSYLQQQLGHLRWIMRQATEISK